jgi:nicotinamide-nucleotide amidase
VSYTNDVKAEVLGVPHELLEQFGAVSRQVAQAMAERARIVLGCDIAVAATGVAGPDPDDRGNPVGLVYVAMASREGCAVRELHGGTGRDRIRTGAANLAFDLVRRHLTGQLREARQ